MVTIEDDKLGFRERRRKRKCRALKVRKK